MSEENVSRGELYDFETTLNKVLGEMPVEAATYLASLISSLDRRIGSEKDNTTQRVTDADFEE